MVETITLTGTEKKKSEITLKQLKDAIPPHCFNRSLQTSSLYLARDLIYASTLFYLSLQIDFLPSLPLRVLAWTAYTFLQGCVGTGIWILAHECGHGAFSPYQTWNDIVGWTLHSLLMVPYFSWKITHARHHRYTNNTERDTAFVPWTEKEFESRERPWYLPSWIEYFEDTPLYSLVNLAVHQLAGWQMYLCFYVSAGMKSRPVQGKKGGWFGGRQSASHFDPGSSLWTEGQRHLIAISDLGLLIVGAGVWYLGQQVGLIKMVLIYVVPYLWVHHWLVAITYLHHTHPSIPHYTDATWTFTKGALSTVDRDFGFIGRHFFHHIIEHHTIHHLFNRIPFYHAEEATDAIIPVLGELYIREDTGFMKSLYQTYKACQFVGEGEKGSGILHWVFEDKAVKAE